MIGPPLELEQAARFAEELGEATSSADVGERLHRLIADCGFLGAACGDVGETPVGPRSVFYFNTWPRDWQRVYRERDFVRYDVIPNLARFTAVPFTWLEISESREWTPPQQAVLDWARGLGVIDGYVMPIHQPGADLGLCVCVAGRPISSQRERFALQLTSFNAYLRCRELGGEFESSTVKAPLSARETDCLRLVMRGKSDKDIARTLEIAPTTVHFHIERVKKKLGVKTRSAAAATVVALGYLPG